MDSSASSRPELQSPQRVVAAPTAPQPQNQDAISSDSPVETLYSHSNVKIISFSASGRGLYRIRDSSSTSAFDEEPGTLAWSSHLERTIAVGPFRIHRAPGSVAFLSCGSALQPILPKSQCWCVDEEGSKFVLQIRRPQYWRIELPVSNAEERSISQEFREILAQILQFEKTHCPFQRPFTVSIPEQPDTPVRKRRWTPVPSSPVPSPDQPGHSPTKSRSKTSTLATESGKTDPSILLEPRDANHVSDSHNPLQEHTTHLSTAGDVTPASDTAKLQPQDFDEGADMAHTPFGSYGLFAEKGVLPVGRIAMLRDIFEKLFSLSIESHSQTLHLRVPDLSSRSAASIQSEPASDSLATGLLATSPTTCDILPASEPQLEMLYDGPERLSAWMRYRIRGAVSKHQKKVLPESTLAASPPAKGAVGPSMPGDVASPAVATSPTESQCSHATSLWHSAATPFPPSPPSSPPSSPDLGFASIEEISFVQCATHHTEDDIAINQCTLRYVDVDKLASKDLLQGDTRASIMLAGGQLEIENRVSHGIAQHAVSALIREIVELPSTSERPPPELHALDVVRKYPLTSLLEIICETLLRLPSYLVRFIPKISTNVIVWEWRKRVLTSGDDGKQSPVQHDYSATVSDDLVISESPCVDLPEAHGRRQDRNSEPLLDPIWDVD